MLASSASTLKSWRRIYSKNSSKYLEDCIKSVIQQNHKDIEHIIIDGRSTDDTVSIIKKYEDHLAYWVSEKDGGMYDAINKGLQLATGDIVGMLHSDDVLASPDVIAAIAASFKSNNVDSLYGDLVYVDPNNINKVLRVWKGYGYKRSKFRYGWMPAHPTFYIKKAIVDKLGGFKRFVMYLQPDCAILHKITINSFIRKLR